MPTTNKDKQVCAKCHTNRKLSDYYKLLTPTDKYPNGYLNVCKFCLGNSYVAKDPSTFMHILHEIDIPWLPVEYFRTVEKSYKPSAPNNIGYLGKYVSAMKLNQFNSYHFKDSDELQRARGGAEDMFDSVENYNYKHPLTEPIMSSGGRAAKFNFTEVSIAPATLTMDAIGEDGVPLNIMQTRDRMILTDEEMVYLRTKWGSLFSPEEYLTLERKYHEMMGSYDIQTAVEEDYVLKICVASLRFDSALSQNDAEGASKLSTIYDRLTKSAGLQPTQNAKTTDQTNSISYLVKLAEEEGPIPRFDVDERPDIVDITLKDFKLFVKRLVSNDESIGDRYELAQEALREQDELLANEELADETEEDEDGAIPFELDVYGEL